MSNMIQINKIHLLIFPANLDHIPFSCPPPLRKIEFENESEVAQSCRTLCNPMDCSPPGSSIHRIFQARVLEWGAISFSRGSSQSRDQTRVSRIVGRCFCSLNHQGFRVTKNQVSVASFNISQYVNRQKSPI